jgi:hypothetical protein
MPVWGIWSLFFAVSAGALALARWLDRAPGARATAVGDAADDGRASMPGAVPSTSRPPPGAAGPQPDPLSVQVPLDS